MRNALLLIIALWIGPWTAGAAAAEKHYLYLSTPDGAQKGGSGNGILIFDIEDGHRFVRRLEVPVFREGLRGFCGNAKRHAVYYSTTNRRLGCYDVEKEKVVWERVYEAGCDRACITPDGKKLYVPTGWWLRGTNSGFLVVNAENGEVLNRLPVGPQAHNSIASLDGQFAYLGTETNFTVFRTSDDAVVRNISGVGESGVFPFTIDSRNRFAYICLGRHVGFDVVDLTTGRVPHRILAGDEAIPHRTHGAGLTPDETELWISDQEGQKLFVFDATQMPPKPKGQVGLTAGGHGWVSFSVDGRYAWCHTSDVIDVRTKKIVATLKDDTGQPVCGSKFIEVHFRDGKVVRMGDQFGLGRAHRTQGSAG
jgi:hypothetical protein